MAFQPPTPPPTSVHILFVPLHEQPVHDLIFFCKTKLELRLLARPFEAASCLHIALHGPH